VSEEETDMSEPFFAMRNHHSEYCGEPPVFDTEMGRRYHSYFENWYGEQWVFVYDRDTRKGELHGGDADWRKVYAVVNGRAWDLILNQEEIL
jgi:hypothetical protein